MANVVICKTQQDFKPYEESWRRFWSNHLYATGYQHHGWFYVLHNAFKVDPLFLVAINESKQCIGGLLLYHTDSLFADSCMTSLENGILAQDQETAEILFREALSLGHEMNTDYLLLKGGRYSFERIPDKESIFLFPTIDLGPPLEDIWGKVAKKTRWAVRKAKDHGFRVQQNKSNLDIIYAIYAQDMKRLGTPVQGFDFFQSLLENLGESVIVHEITRNQEIVGGMMSFAGSSGWINHLATVKGEYKPIFANYLLYWNVIEDAKNQGAASFNLGRTQRGSTFHLFKRKWRGADYQMQYQYFFINDNAGTIKLDTLRKGNSYKQKIWSRLPLPLCNFLGPHLRRKLPFG